MDKGTNHNYSIFKRLSTLILLILCVFIAVNIYLMHTYNAQSWYQQEGEQLGRNLTQQAARLVAAPLASGDEELLDHYVSVVNQGGFVKAAVLFHDTGVPYAGQNNPQGILQLLQNNDEKVIVFVEDIEFEGNIIGYVKLVLDHQAIVDHHQSFNQSQLKQTILMIVLSIIVASLATRMFYKARENYIVKKMQNAAE